MRAKHPPDVHQAFAAPVSFAVCCSGKTVDQVWSAIHDSAPVPPSYNSLPLVTFLNSVGVRSLQVLRALPSCVKI